MKSYGATTIILSYLTRIEQTHLQALNQFMYNIGVSRVQRRLQKVVWKIDPFYMVTMCMAPNYKEHYLAQCFFDEECNVVKNK